MADSVSHPHHYNAHPSGVEAIDIVEHLSFNLGNAVKYLFRRDHKGRSLEDTKKARWYLARELARLQRVGFPIVPTGRSLRQDEKLLLVESTEPRGSVLRDVLNSLAHGDAQTRHSIEAALAFVDVEIRRLENADAR